MAQVPVNPQHVGHQQPTTYQEYYEGMSDTLNGEYTGYLEQLFGPELGAKPASTLRDRIIAAANDVPKVYAMLQDKPEPCIVFVHRPSTR
jgi:hypothetical protein